MDEGRVFEVEYTRQEVTGAIRMCVLESGILKTLGLLGIIGIVVFPLAAILPTNSPCGRVPLSEVLPYSAVVAAVFAAGLAFGYLLVPALGYRLNSLWRHTLELRLAGPTLALTLRDAPEGVEREWSHITRILENEETYVLVYTSIRGDYWIIPKRCLGNQETSFRDALRQRISAEWRVRGEN